MSIKEEELEFKAGLILGALRSGGLEPSEAANVLIIALAYLIDCPDDGMAAKRQRWEQALTALKSWAGIEEAN